MDASEKERLYLEAAHIELKEYLLSPVLYWPIAVASTTREDRTTLPKLTPGNLYLSMEKCRVYDFPAGEKKEVEELLINLTIRINEWQTAWRKKAEKEFQARIRQWGMFINDIKRDKGINRASFSYQVRDRVILQLLGDRLNLGGDIEIQKIMAMDDTVRQLSKPGGFLWADEIIRGFPKNPFWYLYVDVQIK